MPAEYEDLIKEDVFTQIAGQVFYTEKALDQGFSALPTENQLEVPYEDFCEDPRPFVARIKACLGMKESEGDIACRGVPDRLRNTNELRIPQTEMDKLEDAYRVLAGRN